MARDRFNPVKPTSFEMNAGGGEETGGQRFEQPAHRDRLPERRNRAAGPADRDAHPCNAKVVELVKEVEKNRQFFSPEAIVGQFASLKHSFPN